MKNKYRMLTIVSGLLVSAGVCAQTGSGDSQRPAEVFFGDTHFHTSLSPDAGLVGTTLGVAEAYRFARGEEVTSNTGLAAKLSRPLDFLAITDHSEFIGIADMLRDASQLLLDDDYGAWLYDRYQAGPEGIHEAYVSMLGHVTRGEDILAGTDIVPTIWNDYLETAEQYNEPGKFSAILGFEWTSTPGGDNLHRVVLFRDNADRVGEILPFSAMSSSNPEDLWRYLEDYEQVTGGRALAIPHNANLSNGRMFAPQRFDGSQMDAGYAETRAHWEPLQEVSQIKGDSEAHPALSREDEFADFETWDKANLTGSVAKRRSQLTYEYARSVMKLGLRLGSEIGINPFMQGFVAATDSHTGLVTTHEAHYFGKYANSEPGPDRHNVPVLPSQDPDLAMPGPRASAAGLTAVWAVENTREALFDAMRRREVYATTGTRIRLRVFGGWEFSADDLENEEFARIGYEGGVPMGGMLPAPADEQAPTILVSAMKDPEGANLDRIQVIKGWQSVTGSTYERIYDIAVSGNREINADGRAPEPVGTTVDIENATYTNEIGAATLEGWWQDPDFDPTEPAFYYVRVLEIPTPRWTTYDAARYDIELPDGVPAAIQDRAYSSPVWYTP